MLNYYILNERNYMNSSGQWAARGFPHFFQIVFMMAIDDIPRVLSATLHPRIALAHNGMVEHVRNRGVQN